MPPHNKLIEEKVLPQFLKALDDKVFVKSTNSVTMEIEELNPSVEDMEAIIRINGEWDREDLKQILSDLLATKQNIPTDSKLIEEKVITEAMLRFMPPMLDVRDIPGGRVGLEAFFENEKREKRYYSNIDWLRTAMSDLLATREAQIYRRVLAALRPQQQEEVCTEQHTTDKSDIDPDYN